KFFTPTDADRFHMLTQEQLGLRNSPELSEYQIPISEYQIPIDISNLSQSIPTHFNLYGIRILEQGLNGIELCTTAEHKKNTNIT
ncbi:hypothetical protein ACJX0J_020461, partial [Zea mays]